MRSNPLTFSHIRAGPVGQRAQCAVCWCCITGFPAPEVQIFQMITSCHRLVLPECEVASSCSKYLRKCGGLQRETRRNPEHCLPLCHRTCDTPVKLVSVERWATSLDLATLSKPQTLSGNTSTLQWPYFSLLISVLADRNVQQIHIYQVWNLPNIHHASRVFLKHWQHSCVFKMLEYAG